MLISNLDFRIKEDKAFPEWLKFLFGGSYTDLEPLWFKNIGVVILLTMITNVFTTPIVAVV
jgi:hypothetical protein